MYFQFENGRPDTPSLDRAMSRREGLILSVFLHLLVLVLITVLPMLSFVQAAAERRAREAELRRAHQLEIQRERARQANRFVFVQPLIDTEAPAPPERGDLSDKDRVAQAPERAVRPTNPLPFARGNSPERVEAPDSVERPRGEGPGPEPADGEAPGEAAAAADQAGTDETGDDDRTDAGDDPAILDETTARDAPQFASRAEPGASSPAPLAGGSLGEALRNLERYVDAESFNNPGGGGGQFGPSIQFDTKGVEFGPWIRRFIAQIKRNWFVPYAAMTMKGHSVITFNVHKDGALTDVTVIAPSDIQSFNLSARNALLASNPTQPLPPEYPADRAFFTVTFYYNEQPPVY